MDPVITFTYERENEDGVRVEAIERVVLGDHALDDLLAEVKYFLHGVGFSYVESLEAHCGDDISHSSS